MKYLVQPRKRLSWTQTGAIDFVVAGTANLETFADVYEVFSMPYLFTSEEATMRLWVIRLYESGLCIHG